MRTRQEIETADIQGNDYAHTIRLSLEVLLDIRELLQPKEIPEIPQELLNYFNRPQPFR